MIDWYNLIMNACWILGCAVALAALSYASWEASSKEEKFRTCIGKPHIQLALNCGGFLFSAGLAGTSDVVWQRILWIILVIGFLAQIMKEFYQRRNIQKSTK